MQAAIQELKLKNDTLTSVNVNLQEELFAIKVREALGGGGGAGWG